MSSKQRRSVVAMFIVIAVLGWTLILDQSGWAAPVQSPSCQTIPTRRPTPPGTPAPTSDPGNDDGGEDSGGEDAPVPPPSARVYATDIPAAAAVPLPTATLAPVQKEGSVDFPNCRFGVAVVRNPINLYDIAGLNLGWYINFSTVSSGEPGDMEFVRMVRLHQQKDGACRDCYTVPYTYTVTPDVDSLVSLAETSPGSTWIIGNEPDRRDWDTGTQDEMVPELYAQAYYEISRLIRQTDPTAKISLAGVMQATPLRIEYLDRVWIAYESLYGRRLGDDVDIWNVHGYILREEMDEWGAEIPAGMDDSRGMLYDVKDNANLDYFKEQISRFRTWMREKGERDKPLYVGEYGVIIPYLPADQARTFMSSTFDYMLDVTDVELGYPADEFRLVQRFLWYSLDDSSDNPDRVEDYGGALFSSETLERLQLGDEMAAYVGNRLHAEAAVPRVNLVIADLEVEIVPGEPLTATLRAAIQNRGNTRTHSGDGLRVRFWDGRPGNPQSKRVGSRIIGDINGCGYEVTVEQPVSLESGSEREHAWFVDVEVLPEEETARDNIGAVVAVAAD